MAQADGIAHGADYLCEEMAHFGAVSAASAADSAMRAAGEESRSEIIAAVLAAVRSAADATAWDPLEDHDRSVVEKRESQQQLVAAQIADDLQRLSEAARTHAWDDSTPVPPEFFDGVRVEPTAIVQAIAEFSNRLAALIATSPSYLEEVEWRDLERLLARVFSELGFYAKLQPGSKDSGEDIVLEFWDEERNKSYAVQIKHWRSGKRVGRGDIDGFLQVLARERRDGGLYVATSGFASHVVETVSEIGRERLVLGGREKVVSLCRTFVRARQGLWKPPDSLAAVIMAP